MLYKRDKDSERSHHLSGTVLPGCLSKEGQGGLNHQDRRNPPSIVLKVLRAPQHHSSNQGDTAGNPPKRGNKRDKKRRRKSEKQRGGGGAVRKWKKRECPIAALIWD